MMAGANIRLSIKDRIKCINPATKWNISFPGEDKNLYVSDLDYKDG
jgi:hypothetical protein